jgi:hypothetical protein
LYREGLGLSIPEDADGEPLMCEGLALVWQQDAPGRDTRWTHMLQPWDLLAYLDVEANSLLRGERPAGHVMYHTSMAINRDTLITASILNGVAFQRAAEVAARPSLLIALLLRPMGISAWQAVRARG